MHNTYMNNFKCKAITEISYSQTHQLCIYNLTVGSPFPMSINGVMGVQSVPPLCPFYVLNYFQPGLEKNDLSKFSSQAQ
jgi:hypothetical protein